MKRVNEKDMKVTFSHSDKQHYKSKEEFEQVVMKWMEEIYIKYSNKVGDEAEDEKKKRAEGTYV